MLSVAMMIFPEVTVQDFIGPFEVLSRVADFELKIFSPVAGEIRTETGLALKTSLGIDDVKSCGILFIPGGPGINKVLQNGDVMRKVAALGATAQFVTSVCTGSLVLAAAGLLRGYKATSHWRYTDLLTMFGSMPAEGRVVVDRNRITGGGVTAGIDFALTLVAQLVSEERAREIQLQIEYDPEPPFVSGHPSSAQAETVTAIRARTQVSYDLRKKILSEISAAPAG